MTYGRLRYLTVGWPGRAGVRADDSMLVTAEPVRGIPVSASFLRASRLHTLIEAEARDQLLNNKPISASSPL